MKMVKSLLLGSAAGIVAVAGAQAADLPVKAKAVEYVKVCSLYGAGFYYIPGTDTCIKLGGYVRTEYYHNEVGSYPNNGSIGTVAGSSAFTRVTDTFGTRARGMLSADVRTQTEYGTLRSYLRYGQQWSTGTGANTGAPGVNFERAFIQFAGFTFGRTDSYFDFYNGAAYGLTPTGLESTVGPAGINVAAYTAQFGNGVSASISLEDASQRFGGVYDVSVQNIASAPFAATTNDQAGMKVPDIIANLRVDQAWGSAQIMGVLHMVEGRYYNANAAVPGCAANTTACGHPGSEWGWGVGAGLTLKMPWDARDTFSMQAAYTEGATRYAANGVGSMWLHKDNGIAIGQSADGVFASGTGIELINAWSITAAFEHYWTPNLRTSVIGAYADFSYNSTATGLVCANAGTSASTFTAANCAPDWSMWRLGSRTMWNPVANLDVGLEVFYTKINTAFAGATGAAFNPGAATGLPTRSYAVEDENVWTATFRVQRNFWP